jgi:hypothetical protein
MPFDEDLSVFFNPNEFGDAALFNGVAMTGLLDLTGTQVFGDVVESVRPSFACALASVPAVKHGDSLHVRGVDYRVCGIDPDGMIVRLALEQQ